MSSIQNKSVDIMREGDKGSIRYCVECGAKMPKSQKICPACGESQ
jgi:predicted amidophosphoribosyltransferase